MIEFFYNNSIYIATSITSFFAIIKKYSRMKFSIKNHSKKSKSIMNYIMKMKRLHENLYYKLAKININYVIQHDKRYFVKTYFVNQLM